MTTSDTARASTWEAGTHLSKCALHRSQEVGLLQPVVAAVDVEQLETQALHLFKVKVQGEDLGVGGVDAAADDFCPVHLQGAKRTGTFDEEWRRRTTAPLLQEDHRSPSGGRRLRSEAETDQKRRQRDEDERR